MKAFKTAEITKTIHEIRQSLNNLSFNTIALVPTMGALHEGHLSLIKRAAQDCDGVVVSIFVNPLQFGPEEDFNNYPRDLEEDAKLAADAGAGLIFAPSVAEIYGTSNHTIINVKNIGRVLCGKSRPGHFNGVATVVVKLLNIVKPQNAYFGEKDWQQLIIVRRVVVDLNMDVRIVGMATVRDQDGLAVSSRNRYLSDKQRLAAAALPAALGLARDMIAEGERDKNKIISTAIEVIMNQPGLKLDYLSLCRADDLGEIDIIDGKILIAAAVYAGEARLIDNLVIQV